MAGQDLLDQGRAGARQADDEDGIGGVGAMIGAGGEKGRGKQCLVALAPRGRLLGVIRDFGKSQGRALRIVIEGRRIIAGILQRLAQGEVHMQLVLATEVGARQLRVHDLYLGGFEMHGLEIGQTPIGLAQFRRQVQGPTVGRDRVLLEAGGL